MKNQEDGTVIQRFCIAILQKMSVKESWIAIIHQMQDDICTALEACDGKAKFFEDKWED